MKLSIYILTSKNEKLVLRALESIKRQINHDFEVTPIVMVNSLMGHYHDKVYKLVGDQCLVFHSKSNGKPGKGKNACINHFNVSNVIGSDYMMLIDGDDFLYPAALQMLGRTIKNEPDVVCGCAQDHLTSYDPINLTSWQDKEINLAVDINRDIEKKNQYDLWHTFSVDRVFLFKRSFLAPRVIDGYWFIEDMDLYEDFILSAELTLLHQEHWCNYIRINNSFIYCYDAVEQGQCSIFNTNKDLAQWNMDGFWNHMDKLLVLNDHRPIKFSDVPFLKLGSPFNFTQQDKYSYIKELNSVCGIQNV